MNKLTILTTVIVKSSLTSRGMKGSKKQSSSLSREQVRLLSMEVITSFTDSLTNLMES